MEGPQELVSMITLEAQTDEAEFKELEGSISRFKWLAGLLRQRPKVRLVQPLDEKLMQLPQLALPLIL